MLAASDIVVSADIAPPQFPFPDLLTGEVLSKNWFSSIRNRRHGSDYHQISDWNVEFIEWMRQSLSVCRKGILDNLRPPSDYGHAPVEHVDTAGTHWNFPETLAWIATRDPLEVARMRYSRHWEAPIGDDDPNFKSRALTQNDSTRRRMIGWLVMTTALNHCECGSNLSDEREAWESCHCVGKAYDELCQFAKGTNHPIPIYQPKPAYASFALSWPDGAHNLVFLRSDVIARWPANVTAETTDWTPDAMKKWWSTAEAENKEGNKTGKIGYTDGKNARYAFMKLPGTSGLTQSFQRAWQDEHPQAKRGRPKNPT